jgi:hypothetical protein
MKVPTWDGVRRGVDLYKIPQPTSVDMTYEVRLFTNRMKDLNKFNRLIKRAFQSRQCYISVNGHPMPLHLESIGDESNIDDFENRRFYVQLFEMKLLGYILDEDDFEVVPTANRGIVTIEVEETRVYDDIISEPIKVGNLATYAFVFKPGANTDFSFVCPYTINFIQLAEIENISRIVIYVNGVGYFDGTVMTTPIFVNANDRVALKVYKNPYSLGGFKIIGSTT